MDSFPLRAEPSKPPPSYAFWLAFTVCYFLALSFTTSTEKLSLASGLPNRMILFPPQTNHFLFLTCTRNFFLLRRYRSNSLRLNQALTAALLRVKLHHQPTSTLISFYNHLLRKSQFLPLLDWSAASFYSRSPLSLAHSPTNSQTMKRTPQILSTLSG